MVKDAATAGFALGCSLLIPRSKDNYKANPSLL